MRGIVKQSKNVTSMPDSIKISGTIPATPAEIYAAFLDARKHSAMTGAKAIVDATIGGKFTAWDDYISGTTVALDPSRKITQKWRTTDFPTDAPDSTLEILLEEIPTGTKVTFNHSNIPEGQGDQYKDGWKEFYLDPMKAYCKKKQAGVK